MNVYIIRHTAPDVPQGTCGTGEYGQIYFYAQIVVVDGKGEIDPVPPISISPSDIKQLDFYRTKRQDPDIVVIQLKQNSAPH